MELMKDSRIAWIGEVPDSWNIQPLKYISRCNENVLQEITQPDYKFNYIDIGSVSFEKGVESYQEITFESAPSRARRIVNEGDTIISTVRTYLKAIAFIEKSHNVIASTGFAVLHPHSDINCRYLNYFCKNNGFIQEIEKLSYGIAYPSINTELLIKIPIAYPSRFEQQAISDFLDEKCEKIDSIVSDLEKEIEILEKYKKSLITETVTKGLDKNVLMQDSGVDWIGEIPEHWEVKRLKYVIQLSSGDALTNQELNDGDYPVFGGGKQMGTYSKYNVEKGTILIGRVGANCGCITITEYSAWATDNALTVKTSSNIQYIYYALLSAELNKLNVSNAQPLITSGKVGEFKISFINSIKEQRQIADFLDKKCTEIDSTISTKEKQLETIKKYKQSLIYEYVTGKKRVEGFGGERDGN